MKRCKKKAFWLPMPASHNVNIIEKEENKNVIIRSRIGGNIIKAWSELNDFAKNYWRFFMQLCLCGALKIIIMYIISMDSSIYTHRALLRMRKKNVIYFNMHHTSLVRFLNYMEKAVKTIVWCIYLKGMRDAHMQKDGNQTDNAQKSAEGNANAHFSLLKQIKNENCFVFSSTSTFHLMYATSKSASILCFLRKRKKRAAVKRNNNKWKYVGINKSWRILIHSIYNSSSSSLKHIVSHNHAAPALLHYKSLSESDVCAPFVMQKLFSPKSVYLLQQICLNVLWWLSNCSLIPSIPNQLQCCDPCSPYGKRYMQRNCC